MIKKIYVLLFLLLVVFLSVISVNASAELQYNETEVKYNTNTINNINVSVDDKLSDNTDEGVVVDTNITLSLQQGEHVEIVFNQFKLLESQSPDFHINDGVSCSGFYNSNEGHYYIYFNYNGDNAVNVGMNTLTVEYLGYSSTVEKINSNSIQFKTNDLKITKQSKYYSYKFNLNITKKQEKTIQIMNKNISYYFYKDKYIFYKLMDIGEFFDVQLILSKNEKMYYNDKLESWNIDNNYYSFDLSRPYLLEDIKLFPDFYNLTLVNYDGTNDTCLLELKKAPWNILFEYEIINDTVKFQFDSNSFIEYEIIKLGNYSDYNMTIKLGNITKLISCKYIEFCREFDDNVNVLFDNLNDGFYDVVIEIPGNDYIEYFSYATQVEIRNKTLIPDDNINDDISEYETNHISEYNVTNNTVISLINITGDSDSNSSVLSHGNNSNSNSAIVSGSDGKKHSSNKIENNIDDFNEKYVSDYGNLESTRSMQSIDNAKSYEISEKSVSKSIDDLLTKLGVTIFSCMSLMVGYVRFEKNQ